MFRSRLKRERRREEETRFQSRLLLFSTIRERSEEVLSIANDAYISEERIHSEKIRLNAILLMMQCFLSLIAYKLPVSFICEIHIIKYYSEGVL